MKRLFSVVLITLLLSGCVFGVKENVYDGTPAALNVTLKRNTINAMSVMSEPVNEEPKHVNVRIWKTDESGTLIYSVVKQALLESVEAETEGYILSEIVPADKGYKVTALYVEREMFEIDETTVNVPADKVTTVNLALKDLSYLLDVPEKVYSGGSTEQFKLLPSEFEDVLRYQVYLALAPWNGNGNNRVPYLEWLAWSTTSWEGANRFFPEVSEPTKLYYQFSITYNAQVYNPFAYFPNLASGEELPYIWLLPSPDWEDQQ